MTLKFVWEVLKLGFVKIV